MSCRVEECPKQNHAEGFCNKHYSRWKRNGTPDLQPPISAEERFELFMEKVVRIPMIDCWIWGGAVSRGYGSFHWNGSNGTAHRYAYEHFLDNIPEGLHLDHLCRVRRCVNPAHLEPVTPGTNIRRGFGATAMHAVKTHCKHGHEFNAENTYYRKDRPGGRECIPCNRRRTREARRG